MRRDGAEPCEFRVRSALDCADCCSLLIARQLENRRQASGSAACETGVESRSKPISSGEFYDCVLELRPGEFSQFGRMPRGMHHLENRMEDLAVRKRAQAANWELDFERRVGLLRGKEGDGA